jgi:hypothetical protein
LGEQTKSGQDEKTATIARSLEHLEPTVAFELLFELDGLVDLLVFDLDEFVVYIAPTMSFCKDAESLLILPFGNEETWGLWYKPVSVRNCFLATADHLPNGT